MALAGIHAEAESLVGVEGGAGEVRLAPEFGEGSGILRVRSAVTLTPTLSSW